MSTLAHIQGDFQDYLLRGTPGIEQHVFGTTRVPLETRLGIYAGAYGSRLGEALENNYPALAALLGADDFHTLAHAYVTSHDSPYFSIRYYGAALPDFLASHADYAEVPLLAELARWEWTMTCVFDAADAEVLAHAALAAIAPQQWAQLRFSFHPSVRRLKLVWNVPQLWQAVIKEQERPPLSLNEPAVEWLLWRHELSTYFRSLTATDAAVLDAARDGWPFGELCTSLCEQLGEAQAPAHAATLLREWVGAGLITAVA